MNHAGEIAGLTVQARPHVAVITTIAPAHIENLGSEEAIAGAKAEIFAGLEPGGTAVIPADSEHSAALERAARDVGARVVSFGRARSADVRLLDAIPSANGGRHGESGDGDADHIACPCDHSINELTPATLYAIHMIMIVTQETFKAVLSKCNKYHTHGSPER